MMKILVPISLFTACIEWSGWIGYLDFLVQPVMKLLFLPPMAALPLLIGALTGVYGGIAAMAMLPFTVDQMTLMAIFILICHNVIQESIVQGKSGIHPIKALLYRLIPAVITVVLAAQFLDTGKGDAMSTEILAASTQPFTQMLRNWGLTTLALALKIFVIIMSLLTIMEIFKVFGWIDRIVSVFAPLFRIFGLSPTAGVIWITALIFGLAYGAAVIVEEAKKGHLTKQELEYLHLSIGINHSVIEDPSLFLALGLGAFWLWVPRLLTAIACVHLLSLWRQALGK
jgi:spore maturation protein SpmB